VTHRTATAQRQKKSRKSSVRAKVEHAFLIVKRIVGFARVSYRGMVKNGNRLFVMAALGNLFMARRFHLLLLIQTFPNRSPNTSLCDTTKTPVYRLAPPFHYRFCKWVAIRNFSHRQIVADSSPSNRPKRIRRLF